MKCNEGNSYLLATIKKNNWLNLVEIPSRSHLSREEMRFNPGILATPAFAATTNKYVRARCPTGVLPRLWVGLRENRNGLACIHTTNAIKKVKLRIQQYNMHSEIEVESEAHGRVGSHPGCSISRFPIRNYQHSILIWRRCHQSTTEYNKNSPPSYRERGKSSTPRQQQGFTQCFLLLPKHGLIQSISCAFVYFLCCTCYASADVEILC